MKKIENLLALPLLIVLFAGASKYSERSIDIQLNDTFYLFSGAAFAGWSVLWLVIVFCMFKLVRRRHQQVQQKFGVVYILLTTLFLGVFLYAGLSGDVPNMYGVSDADLHVDNLLFRNKLKMVAIGAGIMAQVIFLLYFAGQLLKKPASPAAAV